MFTGIVEEVGKVERVLKGQHSIRLEIQAKLVLEDIKIGDSIAVNGVCLTVTFFSNQGFSADVVHETLNRSTLALLRNGVSVNLERAMPINGRFGGHIVAGHIDNIGKIMEIRQDDRAIWYTIQTKTAMMKYIVEKGSIAIDGISLTVAKVFSNSFSISTIPHTVKMTVLSERRVGDSVNLETDMIGKYIEKLIFPVAEEQKQIKSNKISQEFLFQHGYFM